MRYTLDKLALSPMYSLLGLVSYRRLSGEMKCCIAGIIRNDRSADLDCCRICRCTPDSGCDVNAGWSDVLRRTFVCRLKSPLGMGVCHRGLSHTAIARTGIQDRRYIDQRLRLAVRLECFRIFYTTLGLDQHANCPLVCTDV